MSQKRRPQGQVIPKGRDRFLVRVPTGKDPTGKRLYHNKMVYGSPKDAQGERNSLLVEIASGRYIPPTNQTLNSFLDYWLEKVAIHRVAPRTFDDYQGLVNRYVRNTIGTILLEDVGCQAIQSLYSEMMDRGLSARPVRQVHTVLNSSLKQAVRWRMIQHNPCADVDLPRYRRRPVKAMGPDQAACFLQAAKNELHGFLFAFVLTTGLRFGEFAGLLWEDVDWCNSGIQIQRALYRPKGGGFVIKPMPKTDRSRRTVTLGATILGQLRNHRKQQMEQVATRADHDLVFTAENGSPLNSSNLLKRHYRPLLKKAGLPETLRLHDLRHSMATLLLAGGEHAKVVQERLGHSTVAFTLDVYSHAIPGMQKAAADKLESMLFG